MRRWVPPVVAGALGSGLRQSIAGRTAARCTPQGSWRAVLSSGGPCWASVGTAGLAAAIHEHKNADFVSKQPKISEKSPILTQKPQFCARKCQKWGSRRQKAHKNPDFVLGMPENGGSKGKKRTKIPILCSGRRESGTGKWGIGIGKRKMAFLQITARVSKMQILHNQIINSYQRAR